MLTNQQADATYRKAVAALHSAVASPDATPEQKQVAKEKREELITDYIDQAIASVEARTKKFQTFIDKMNAVIAEFDPSTNVAGIVRLMNVVDEASGLLTAATGAGAVRGGMVVPGEHPSKAPRRTTHAAASTNAPTKGSRGTAKPGLAIRKQAAKQSAPNARRLARKAAPKRTASRKPAARRSSRKRLG